MKLRLSRRSAAFLAAALLLVAFGTYHLFFSERIDTVVEGRVYRSAQLSADALERFVREKGIRTVINLRGGSNDAEWYQRERGIAEKSRIRLYDIALSPHDLPEYAKLQSVLEVLQTSERPLLIHCRRGSDRTGMVSALALSIEQDPPLASVKRQFSWRYGVFPFYRSVGPRFFSAYEQWLARTQRTHDRKNLLYWMENEYVDEQRNLEFWISDVNGVKVRNRKITMDGNPGRLVMEGWAFDVRTKTRAEDIRLTIDRRVTAKADFPYQRPDAARHFGLGQKYTENFAVGWKAEFDTAGMGTGCHDVAVTFRGNGAGILEGPEGFQVCF